MKTQRWRIKTIREIQERIDQGAPPKEVALQIGVSVWTVYRAIGPKKNGKTSWKNVDRSKIVDLIANGYCPKKVSSLCCVSVWTVYRAIKAFGLENWRFRLIQIIDDFKKHDWAGNSNQFKNRARQITQIALRNRILEKKTVCDKCDGEKPDAHHPDYNDPLNVKWLCRKCHVMEHFKNRKKS